MSDFQELQRDILHVMDSVNEWGRVTLRYSEAVNEQVAKLWEDNAELRNELHALANRVERLTQSRLTEPAEVAARIVNDANRQTTRITRGDYDPETGEITFRFNEPDAA
jgi:regulator of replication initiation timing